MATKIRTLGEGKLNITDTTNARDFSGDVTKAQLVASNSSEDPVNFLDGSQETSTTTTWTLEGTIGDDFGSDSLSLWCFDHAGETLPFESSRTSRAESSGPETWKSARERGR